MDENKKIIGYNTQTGEPIYGTNPIINNTNYYRNNNQFNKNNNKFNKLFIISLLSVIAISLIVLLLIIFRGINNSSSRINNCAILLYPTYSINVYGRNICICRINPI